PVLAVRRLLQMFIFEHASATLSSLKPYADGTQAFSRKVSRKGSRYLERSVRSGEALQSIFHSRRELANRRHPRPYAPSVLWHSSTPVVQYGGGRDLLHPCASRRLHRDHHRGRTERGRSEVTSLNYRSNWFDFRQ
ncbi:hypothetical protein WA026_005694, partial [Henosepilachna vigintioctopunctata]